MCLMSFSPPLKKPLTDVSQSRGSRSVLLSAAATLLWTWGSAAVVIASLVCLAGVEHHPGEPNPEDRPGSGTIIRTEVTAIWVPQALCDLRATRPTRRWSLLLNDFRPAWHEAAGHPRGTR